MKDKENIIIRRSSKKIKLGDVYVGGDAPITVQSMCNTDTRDVEKTVLQIKHLQKAGCEIIRVAVPDDEAAAAIKKIKGQITIPIVADIHFDYRLALRAVESGADGLRINPGNIGGMKKVRQVADAAKAVNIPIRIGVNGGSLDKKVIEKYKGACPEAAVESAVNEIRILENAGFDAIKLSIKFSDVHRTILSYKMLSEKVPYPLHIGVTEAGSLISGTVKSAMGIGMLLNNGIGDTLRVSLTRDPVEEVQVGYEILKALGIRQRGINWISCPTCGRCEIDLFSLVEAAEKRLAYIRQPITVAVMGCVVNGPDEAKEADIGVAGGRGTGIIFKKGKLLKKIPENELLNALIFEVESLTNKN